MALLLGQLGSGQLGTKESGKEGSLLQRRYFQPGLIASHDANDD